MNTPNPDPGEEYPHINTQLFGTVDPEDNRFQSSEADEGAVQRPARPGAAADDGRVRRRLRQHVPREMGRQPTYDEYAQIMSGYTPEQMPVLSTIARGFATFDHWFCEVPSQTFTNRSFFHAAHRLRARGQRRRYDSFPQPQRRRDDLRPARRRRADVAGLLRSRPCALLAHRADPRAAARRAASPPTSSPRDDFFDDAEQRQAADLLVHRAADLAARPQRHAPRRSNALVARRCRRDPPSLDLLRRRGPAGAHLRRDPRPRPRRPARTSPTRCSWSPSTSTAAPTTTSRRRRAARPTRPAPPGRWASASTAPASASRRSRSPPGSTERTVVNDEYRNTSLIRDAARALHLGPPLTARDASRRRHRPDPHPDRPARRRTGPRSPPARCPVPGTLVPHGQAAPAARQVPPRRGHRPRHA